MKFVEVTPAYGRVYTTAKAAKADWLAGKDFMATTGGYLGIGEATVLNLHVTLRYGQNGTKLTTLQ